MFGQSTTSASQVRYIVEGTATSAAAGVAEGGTKPESTLVMSEVVEPIKKIATVLPISDEILEDAPSIQTYLNGRLSLFVRIEEERQLLRGHGHERADRPVQRRGRPGDQPVHEARGGRQRGRAGEGDREHGRVGFLQPDTMIMHPTNWLTTRLLRDGTGGTAGKFFGGGPFTGAYGNGGATGVFGESLWNTPGRAVHGRRRSGTALVGNFGQGAHIWRRGGVTVEATNSPLGLLRRRT